MPPYKSGGSDLTGFLLQIYKVALRKLWSRLLHLKAIFLGSESNQDSFLTISDDDDDGDGDGIV